MTIAVGGCISAVRRCTGKRARQVEIVVLLRAAGRSCGKGYRAHPETWEIYDWEQVLGRCAGSEGAYLLKSESVRVSKEEELTFDSLFKNPRTGETDTGRRTIAIRSEGM